MQRENGFTLVEMIVTLIAGVMLVGGVFLVYLMAMRSWQEGAANVSLERTAGVIMEKMVRGVNGRFGLREADIGTVQVSEDGHSVTYMVDKLDPPTPWNNDDVTSRYYYLGMQVWHDPDVSIAGDEIALNRFGDVEALDFSLSNHVLNARLLLTADPPRTRSRKLSVRMQTHMFLRKRR